MALPKPTYEKGGTSREPLEDDDLDKTHPQIPEEYPEDEFELLAKPIDKHETPEYLEMRRQAVIKQTTYLERRRRELKAAEEEIEYDKQVNRTFRDETVNRRLSAQFATRLHTKGRPDIDWHKEVTRVDC